MLTIKQKQIIEKYWKEGEFKKYDESKKETDRLTNVGILKLDGSRYKINRKVYLDMTGNNQRTITEFNRTTHKESGNNGH